MSTVREAGHIPFSLFAERISGHAALTVAGNLALIGTSFLLMLVKTQLAHIGMLCLCAAAVINAVDWAQATAVQRELDGAELVEEPSPAPQLTESSGTERS